MATRQPKRFAPTDLDNTNIAAGAGIELSKLADFPIPANGTQPFTGNQSMGNNKLTNLATGTANGDGVNLGQLNAAIATVTQLFTPKGTVRVGTTANISLSGTQTIDGVALSVGDRVLVKNQTSAAQNGVYLVASGAWSRALDMDTWAEVPGSWLTIQQGATQADTVWLGTADQGGTLETTAITYVNPLMGLTMLSASNFVFDETPAGAVNGVNTTFTLANTPVSGTLRVHINGYRLRAGTGNDYTLTGSTLTILTPPLSGEYIAVDYIK